MLIVIYLYLKNRRMWIKKFACYFHFSLQSDTLISNDKTLEKNISSIFT